MQDKARASTEPPFSLPPPGQMDRITAVIVCGMLVNELHWIGAWLLARMAG